MADNHIMLLSLKRQNITDTCFFGSMYFAYKDNITFELGLSSNSICFLRSLAKPLQAAIISDCNIIKDYNLSNKELAIAQGSHSGTKQHLDILKKMCKKASIKISDFELEAQFPLDKKDFKGKKTKLHNNCSGKHLLMMMTSKYLGYDIKNYTNENHPIQKLINKKQTELSGYDSNILTYDGCSTPLWGLPVKNLIKAYYNLLNDENYSIQINAILKNPYIYGGNNRLDTEIIKLSNGKLFSKVGAGGFVLIYNFKTKEQLIVKTAQDNNPQRRLIALTALNKLKWLNCDIDNYVYNQKNQKVAKYCYEFDF